MTREYEVDSCLGVPCIKDDDGGMYSLRAAARRMGQFHTELERQDDELEKLRAENEALKEAARRVSEYAGRLEHENVYPHRRLEMLKADPYRKAVDEALVCAHLGVTSDFDTYEDAKRKLNQLICYEVGVREYFETEALRAKLPRWMPSTESRMKLRDGQLVAISVPGHGCYAATYRDWSGDLPCHYAEDDDLGTVADPDETGHWVYVIPTPPDKEPQA